MMRWITAAAIVLSLNVQAQSKSFDEKGFVGPINLQVEPQEYQCRYTQFEYRLSGSQIGQKKIDTKYDALVGFHKIIKNQQIVSYANLNVEEKEYIDALRIDALAKCIERGLNWFQNLPPTKEIDFLEIKIEMTEDEKFVYLIDRPGLKGEENIQNKNYVHIASELMIQENLDQRWVQENDHSKHTLSVCEVQFDLDYAGQLYSSYSSRKNRMVKLQIPNKKFMTKRFLVNSFDGNMKESCKGYAINQKEKITYIQREAAEFPFWSHVIIEGNNVPRVEASRNYLESQSPDPCERDKNNTGLYETCQMDETFKYYDSIAQENRRYMNPMNAVKSINNTFALPRYWVIQYKISNDNINALKSANGTNFVWSPFELTEDGSTALN